MNNEIAFAEFMTKDKWFILCSHEEGSWPSWWWGTMGQRPDVTRCQWYIFVWISALANPNGGHTLRKCAQIVIQWYFEGCIRYNVRLDPPNKHLCSMSSGYFIYTSTFSYELTVKFFLTDLIWSSISMRHLASAASLPPVLLPRLHRQTITQPRPSVTFLSGLKQPLSLTSAPCHW